MPIRAGRVCRFASPEWASLCGTPTCPVGWRGGRACSTLVCCGATMLAGVDFAVGLLRRQAIRRRMRWSKAASGWNVASSSISWLPHRASKLCRDTGLSPCRERADRTNVRSMAPAAGGNAQGRTDRGAAPATPRRVLRPDNQMGYNKSDSRDARNPLRPPAHSAQLY